MTQNDIQKIISRIQADAKGKLDAIAEEKRKEIASIDRDAAQRIEARKAKLTDEHKHETTRIGKRMHSAARLDAKRVLLQAREEVIEQIFDKVEQMLQEMPAKEYEAFLKTALKTAHQELGNDIVVHCRREDTDIVKGMADSGVKLEIAGLERDTIGGILVESRGSGAIMNFMFENIIQRKRPLIREEIGRVLYPDATYDVKDE